MNQRKDMLVGLGEAIRERRLALELSQEELAQSAGVHRTYLSDIERGRRNITVVVLERIAGSLDTSIHKLVRAAEEA